MAPEPAQVNVANMSGWTDMAQLEEFAYTAMRREILRRRRRWFHAVCEAVTACWWVPAGIPPSADEAEERVPLLRDGAPPPTPSRLNIAFAAPGR